MELVLAQVEQRRRNHHQQQQLEEQLQQLPDDDIFIESDCSSLEDDYSFAKDSLKIAKVGNGTTRRKGGSQRQRQQDEESDSSSSSINANGNCSYVSKTSSYTNDSVEILRKLHPNWVTLRRKLSSESFDSVSDDDDDDSDCHDDSVLISKRNNLTNADIKNLLPTSSHSLPIGEDVCHIKPVQFGNSAA